MSCKLLKKIVLLLSVCGFSACSSTPVKDYPAPVEDRGNKRPAPAAVQTFPVPESPDTHWSSPDEGRDVVTIPYHEDASTVAPNNSAVTLLLATATQQADNAELSASAATLERALRIDQRNPRIWQRLAKVRLAQQQYALAESLAAKSNLFAGEDQVLINDNWRIIAQARQSAGDARGAAAARQNIRGMP